MPSGLDHVYRPLTRQLRYTHVTRTRRVPLTACSQRGSRTPDALLIGLGRIYFLAVDSVTDVCMH